MDVLFKEILRGPNGELPDYVNFATNYLNGNLSVDMFPLTETEGVEINVELPGFDKDDITLCIELDILKISAKKTESNIPEPRFAWELRERLTQTVSRTIKLPFKCDNSDISAKLTNGVLQIIVNKPEAVSGVNIPIL